MTLMIEYAGTRQGMLYISHRLKRAPEHKQHEIWWHCACDCGNKVSLTSYQLRRGRVDCGCITPIIRTARVKNKNKCKTELKLHPAIEQFMRKKCPGQNQRYGLLPESHYCQIPTVAAPVDRMETYLRGM